MNKIILTLALVFSIATIHAQNKPAPADSIQAYAGKYVFPDGMPIQELNILVEDTVLYAESTRGKTTLKTTETVDVYEVVEYGGVLTFKRNADRKVIGIKIEVSGFVMEGVKAEAPKQFQ